MPTSIEWTDETWNPTRGCSRVSEGCRNCYAERVASRFNGTKIVNGKRELRPFAGFAIRTGHGPQWTGRVELIESKLTEPLHWKKPRRVFVNSMSDLFHEALPDEAIDRVFAVMALCPHITFQVLTKREDRMREYFRPSNQGLTRHAIQMIQQGRMMADTGTGQPTLKWPLPNVWLGVSVEDQANKYRIDMLRQTPGAVRFLSIEPLLEDIGELDLTGIHWVIVGGESGPGARSCDVEWIRSIIRQCKAAGVPLFVKQLGANPVEDQDLLDDYYLDFDAKGGNWESWPADLRVREFPR